MTLYVLWNLKLLVNKLFVQQLVQATNKDTSKVCIVDLYVVPLTKGPIMWIVFPCDDVIMTQIITAKKLILSWHDCNARPSNHLPKGACFLGSILFKEVNTCLTNKSLNFNCCLAKSKLPLWTSCMNAETKLGNHCAYKCPSRKRCWAVNRHGANYKARNNFFTVSLAINNFK